LLPCLYSSPGDLAWRNARQLFVDGDLLGSVADLKTTDGKDIVLYGGVRLAQDMPVRSDR
jgi:dihydrofolate reductase